MISSIKDLKTLFQLCRKQGISELNLPGVVSFKMGELPVEQKSHAATEADPENPYSDFPDGELTLEQQIFYSAGGLPENDPYREDQ